MEPLLSLGIDMIVDRNKSSGLKPWDSIALT